MHRDNKQAAKAGTTPRSIDGVAAAAVHRRRTGTGAPTRQRGSVRASGKTRRTVTASDAKSFPLPKYYAPSRPTRIVRKRATRLKIALRITGVVAAVFLVTGGFFAWKAYSKLHKVFHGTGTVEALAKKTVPVTALKGEGDGRVNILLLGVGGPGHDGPDLTDTIVVLSVDPVNNTATMVSVPRDLWVDQPVNYFGKQQKINAAYESGKYHHIGKLDPSNKNAAAVEAGFDSIDTVMKNVLDVNINYHVLVNFQAFRQAIDTVGGVTVNVPEALIDPTMAWENHWSSVLAPAGVQQMDGVKALLYARSRETSSDFARAERQRQILVALKDKVLTAGTLSNPAKIDGLMNAFGDNVFSDLSTQGATRLVSIMKNIGDSKIKSIGMTDDGHKLVTTDRVGNISVVRPVAGFNNYAAIQAYVHSQIPDGYIVKEHAGIAVLGTTTAGAAATGATLTNYGYNVVSTGAMQSAVTAPVTVIDLSKGKKPYTLHYLEARYGVKAQVTLPAGLSAPQNAQFIIVTK